ncbi:MAG TPA: SPOR domain-containing protein [Limnobacter sp.]|nr:SPOR domain-containing protein [Limnobacter sp.]
MSSSSRSTARNKVNNDQVDELKRKSRRRLVGSIALFLAAIIVVPALVENEPTQTASDVELVVPARPSADTPVELAKVPEQPKLDAPAATQAPAPAVLPPPSQPVEPIAAPVEPKPEPKVEPKPEPKVEPKQEAKTSKPASEDPIAQFAKGEVYWVQVAAVSEKARADALVKELGGKGFAAKVESIKSGNNTVFRVRVGPLSGQAKADETKAKLAQAGYSSGRVVQ